MKNIKNECKTISRNGRSIMYYKGYPLVYTIYEEQPEDLEHLQVELIESSEEDYGEIELFIKTPISYSETEFDYSIPIVFSKEEYEVFERVSYDQLNRPGYPLQNRVDNGYLVECTKDIGYRAFISSDLMMYYISKFGHDGEMPHVNNFFFELDEVYKNKEEHVEVSEYSPSVLTHFEDLEFARFYFKSHFIRAVKYEDSFGPFIVFEAVNITSQEKLTIDKWIDPDTKAIYITLNSKLYDVYKPVKGGLVGTYTNVLVDPLVIQLEEPKKLITLPLNTVAANERQLEIGTYISRTKYNRGRKLPDNLTLLDTQTIPFDEANGTELLDYMHY